MHIQTRAKGEHLYIRQRSDANVLSGLLNSHIYLFRFINNLKSLHRNYTITMATLKREQCSSKYVKN